MWVFQVFHENCPAEVDGPNLGYLADSAFSELHHQGVHHCLCKYPPRKNSSDSIFVSTAGVPGVRNSCPHLSCAHSHWQCLHCRVRPLGDVTSLEHHIIIARQFRPQCQPSKLSTVKIIGRSWGSSSFAHVTFCLQALSVYKSVCYHILSKCHVLGCDTCKTGGCLNRWLPHFWLDTMFERKSDIC